MTTKLWGIRHIRYFYLRYRLLRWWDQVGCHYWLTPNEADWKYLDDVWDGKR